MGLVFNPNKFSSTKRAAVRDFVGPFWEDYKYYFDKKYGWLNPFPAIRSWLQPDISTMLRDPQQRQAFLNAVSEIAQDPQQRRALQDMLSKILPDVQQQQQQQQQQFLKQRVEPEVGKILGGYFTLPALLALLSAIFTDKPIVPILLGLAGLGIAHFFPEVREYVNAANWLEALKAKQEGTGTEQKQTTPKEKPIAEPPSEQQPPEEPPPGPKPLVEPTPPTEQKPPEEPPPGPKPLVEPTPPTEQKPPEEPPPGPKPLVEPTPPT